MAIALFSKTIELEMYSHVAFELLVVDRLYTGYVYIVIIPTFLHCRSCHDLAIIAEYKNCD